MSHFFHRHISGSTNTTLSHRFVLLQPMFLLITQGPLVQIDDVLAVLWVVVLGRPVIRCLLEGEIYFDLKKYY